MEIILASGSAARAAMLRAAGVAFRVVKPRVDEEAAKASLRADGLGPRALADALAELKALSVSRVEPGLVIGADQVLELEGATFDKPDDRAAAAAHLRRLRGRAHTLISAVVVARDGTALWREVRTAKLRMRAFSDAFLESYLDEMGPAAFASVGAYQAEGLGAQLFESIEGDWFTVLGLPLLPLLGFLREHQAVAT